VANNDIWEVIDVQEMDGQEILNVYFYRSDNVGDVGGDAEALASEFVDGVIQFVTPFQNAALVHTEVRVRNLFNPADTFELPISRPGETGLAADHLPVFTAIPFRLAHGNGAVKPGSKRIAGISEDAQVDGVITASGYLTFLAGAADAMLDALPHVSLIDVWYPVVVKRILDGGSYRLPENSGEAVFGVLLDVLFDVLLSSQTSRKIGVGS